MRLVDRIKPPYDDGGDEDSGEEVPCEFVVAGCDAAEVLDATEHAFDEISLAVGDGIVRDQGFSSRVAGDDGLGSPIGDQVAQPVCIIGRIGKQPGEGADRRDEGRGNRDIAGVAGGQRQDPRPALIVRQGMDFGGAPAS